MSVSSSHQFNTDGLQSFYENLDEEDRREVTRKGYNRIVDNNMMFYMMVSDQDIDVEMPESDGLLTKAKKSLFGAPTVDVVFGEPKMYSFTVKMAEKLGIGVREAVEFLVTLGAVQHVEDEMLDVKGRVYSHWVDVAEERRKTYNEKIGADKAGVEVIDPDEWENKGNLQEVEMG